MARNLQFRVATANANEVGSQWHKIPNGKRVHDPLIHAPLIDIDHGKWGREFGGLSTVHSAPSSVRRRGKNWMIIRPITYAKPAKGRGFGARDANTVSRGYWLTRPEYRRVMQFARSGTTEEMLNTLLGYRANTTLAAGSLKFETDLSCPAPQSFTTTFSHAYVISLLKALGTLETNAGKENAPNPNHEEYSASHSSAVVDIKPTCILVHLEPGIANAEIQEYLKKAHSVHSFDYTEDTEEHHDDTGSYGKHVAEWFWIMHARDACAHAGEHHYDLPKVSLPTPHQTHSHIDHADHRHIEPEGSSKHPLHANPHHIEHAAMHPAHHGHPGNHHHGHHAAHLHLFEHLPHHQTGQHGHHAQDSPNSHSEHEEGSGFLDHLRNGQVDPWWAYRVQPRDGGKHENPSAFTGSLPHHSKCWSGHSDALVGIEYKLGSERAIRRLVASATQPTE